MKSVINNQYIITIKNSKFICLIYQIQNEDEIKKYLNQAKEEYPNATHYCYAYILNSTKKESDDGEPSGTAGIPMLQVLEKNNLNFVLCITVRYFGKIKLGANGLIRAYTNCVTSCLKDHIIELTNGLIIEIHFPYSYLKKIDYLLQSNQITKKEFDNIIKYQVIIQEEKLNILRNINSEIKINIIKEILIPKEQ